MLFTVPRYLQKFASQVLVGLGSTSRIKRRVYDAAMAIGARLRAPALGGRRRRPAAPAPRGARGPSCSAASSTSSGFDQLELVISGGAPLPPETAGAVADAAASTSSRSTARPRRPAPSSAGQPGPFPRPGDVGTVVRGLGGEAGRRRRDPGALARPVRGYWNQPEATARDRRRRTAGCTPATSANGGRPPASWSIARATSSSPSGGKTISPSLDREPAARQPLHRPRRWCSATAANISPR